MAGGQDMNGSMGGNVTFVNAHNISFAEEKVETLKRERSMNDDVSVLSIRYVSSAAGRTLYDHEQHPTDFLNTNLLVKTHNFF
jgi:hypothetical protein